MLLRLTWTLIQALLCGNFVFSLPDSHGSGGDQVKLYPRYLFNDLEKKIQGGIIPYVDVAQLTEMIMYSRKKANNREAFVKNALFQGIYSCNGNCSVLVFHLSNNYEWIDAPLMNSTIFTTVRYVNYNYGVWVFQDPAKFKNLGGQGLDNWAYYGRIDKSGNILAFDRMYRKASGNADIKRKNDNAVTSVG